jgi:hypothetical protein
MANTSPSLKRTALAFGGAALLLCATVGLSQAQSAPSAKPSKQQQQAVINLAATKLGLSGDQLSEALKSSRKDLGLGKGHAQIGKLVRAELSVAATTLNYPGLQAMRKDLAGTTLAALASSRIGSPTPVANALKADVDARIQAMVTAGTLNAGRAATLTHKAEGKVDALMTRQFKAARRAQG